MLAIPEIKWLGEELALYHPLDKVRRDFHLSQAPIRWFFGGNQCLGGEQPIYDPVEKTSIPVSERTRPFHVYAFDGQKVVIASANTPFKKEKAQLYRLRLSNGQTITCSGDHLVLGVSGEWQRISELRVGSFLFQPPSIPGNDPLALSEDALHCSKKVEGSQAGYRSYCRFCGEPLHWAIDIDLNDTPSLSDARRHSCYGGGREDAQGSNIIYNHPCQRFDRPSNLDVWCRISALAFDTLYRVFCKLYKSALDLRRACFQSMPAFCPVRSTAVWTQPDSPSISAFCHDLEEEVSVSCCTPKSDSKGIIAVTSVEVKRFDYIWDFTVPHFHNYLAGGIIHHNSGKTFTNMMDLAMLVMGVHPARTVKNGLHWACIESWEQVRDILWESNLKRFIPPHQIFSINYGQDRVPRRVLLKNGSRIEFKAFNQGRDLFQGRAIDSCYCDEQCHHDFQGIFNEIQARLLAKSGRLSWSMTPIIPQPYLEERIEDLPDTDEVFYADLNSNRVSLGGYIPDERIDAMIDDWPEEVQATRIRGEFASFYGAVYKTFNRRTHVIKPFEIPEGWPKYRGFDFGFTNPFVCLWMTKDKDNVWYVYREYYKAKTGIDEHIGNILRLSGDEHYIESWADPENAADRAALRKAGIPTKPARKDVARGIETVQAKLKIRENGKPGLYIFNNCRNTCRELATYSYPSASKQRNAQDLPMPKNDHTCFVAGTLIETQEGEKPIEQIQRGDKVLTRQGYYPVVASGMTYNNADVITVAFSDGSELTGTKEHPIYVQGKGFIPLVDLRYGDTIVSSCYTKKSYTKMCHIEDTPIQQYGQIKYTTEPAGIQNSAPGTYTGKSGKMLMAKFLKVMRSIIKTGIRSITSSITLNSKRVVYIKANTPDATTQKVQGYAQKSFRRLPNGTDPLRAANGIANMLKRSIRSANRWLRHVYSVAKNIMIWPGEIIPDFAPISANLLGDGKTKLITKSEPALYAKSSFQPTNTARQNAVPENAVVYLGAKRAGKAPVYNLTVDTVHEYYANSILVSNCDALRYVIYSVDRPGRKGSIYVG